MIDHFWIQMACRQLLQVSLSILVVWLIVRLCARHRPQLAYLLWMLVLLKCVTPPIWGSPVGLFSRWQFSSDPLVSVLTTTADTDNIGTDRQETAGIAKKPIVLRQGGSPPLPTPRVRTTPSSQIESLSVGWPVLALAGIWLAGMLVIAGRIYGNWRQFQDSLMTDRETAALVSVKDQVRRLAARLLLDQTPRVVVTQVSTAPAVYGFLRPTIVLPESLLGLGAQIDLEPVLAHELVHVHRADTLAGRLQLIVQVIWWFHPLVWWANFEARRERERACDEMVITLMEYDPLRYAGCLVRIAEVLEELCAGQPKCHAAGVPVFTSFRLLANRIEHITTHANAFRRQISWRHKMTAGIFAALLLPGAATGVLSQSIPVVAAGVSADAVPITQDSTGNDLTVDRTFFSEDTNSRQAVVHAPVIAGIRIDGHLGDWPAAMPRHSFFKILADGAQSWEGTDFSSSPDLSCIFMVGYNLEEQLLYVAVVVRDDKLIIGNSRDDDTDAVELYIDGLRSRRTYPWHGGTDPTWFESIKLRNLPVQQYCALPGPGPVYGSSKTTNPLLAGGDLERTKTKMAYTRIGDIITYEWAVQVFDRYPDRPTILKPGARIGFDVAVVDKDVPLIGKVEDESPADRRAWIYWGPDWYGTKTFDANSLGEIVLDE